MVSVVAPIGTWSSLGSCLTLTLTFFFATDAAENYASGVFLYYVFLGKVDSRPRPGTKRVW
jgi:hypothetical protein